MNLIRTAIDRPIAVAAAMIMIVLFGLIALQAIPIQLAPDVDRPVISITTIWPGAAPVEVEREILNRQEEQMSGIAGLQTLTGSADLGRSRLTLEFSVSTDMDKALLLVANRLDRVTGYPDEVRQPTLDTAGSEDSPIAWFNITRVDGNDKPVHEFGDFIDDVVKNRLERVPGVGIVNVYGGSEQEIHVIVEPEFLARYALTISDVVQALRNANVSVSAGSIDEGKRRYSVRAEGELAGIEKIRNVVLRSGVNDRSGNEDEQTLTRVRLGDIAIVEEGFTDPAARIRMSGKPALAVNATRETNANVIETMRGIRTAVEELNASQLPAAGLRMIQTYDETVYIDSAVELVRQNIVFGGLLAIIVLMLFLRSWRPTLIVAVAIPVSIVGSFVAMAALGRSINVISLAGLAFAVGMVVDAAIVVMENVYRFRESGRSARDAAWLGTSQVWGAVLVSALTTVMVFIPLLILDQEVGQLFRDIAVAISVAVSLSLLVSVTVIPAMSRWLLSYGSHSNAGISRFRIAGVDNFAAGFVNTVTAFVRRVVRSPLVSIAVVLIITVLATGASYKFLPKLEYLPEGNRNLIFGFIVPPPGYNLPTVTKIAEGIEAAVRPYWKQQDQQNAVAGDGAQTSEAKAAAPDLSESAGDAKDPPQINTFFFVATRSRTFLGASATDPNRVKELIPIMQGPVFSEPGTFGFITQPSIFGRGIGGGRKIELDVSGPDLGVVLGVAGQAFGMLSREMPRSEGNQHRPQPGLELGSPEVRVIPDRIRLADNGLTAAELAQSIDAFNDGIKTGEITIGGRLVSLVLRGPDGVVNATQDVGGLPVVTSDGRIVSADSLAEIKMTNGPTSIRHRERARTVTLEVRPAPGIALEQAMDVVRGKIMQPLLDQGLPPGVKLGISGTARKLDATWESMRIQLLLALAIVFLVMAVLFESFVYPLIIMLSVPVAAAGGVAGLVLLNQYSFQPLDMLTMLGFVILVGIVVNNAILLVHQTIHHIRIDAMVPEDAIVNATRNRIRPIFMSTLTSVVGMLPLVLRPGAGSELYRGLGSVVVGGLSLSALLTLLLVPPMLALLVAPLERRRQRRAQVQPTSVGAMGK